MILHYIALVVWALLVAVLVLSFLILADAWIEGTKDIDHETSDHDYYRGPSHWAYHLGQLHEHRHNQRIEARDARRKQTIRERGAKL